MLLCCHGGHVEVGFIVCEIVLWLLLVVVLLLLLLLLLLCLFVVGLVI